MKGNLGAKGFKARAAPGAKDGQGTGQIAGLQQQLALSCCAHALMKEKAKRGLHGAVFFGGTRQPQPYVVKDQRRQFHYLWG